MNRLLVAAALAASLGSAQADPVRDYKLATTGRDLSCRMDLLNAQMTQDLGNKPTNEFAVCLAEGDRQAKELYVLAAEQVAAKPAAVAALKEHLIRVLAQLRGLKANTNEPKVNYNARQASLKAAVQEAWNRFEVEAL